jgi:RNA polymerase sigma-B factor
MPAPDRLDHDRVAAGCAARRGRTAERLIHRWRQTGDGRYRTSAIEAYMPLARRLARRFHRGRESLDDLRQVAYVGLVKSVDRFDPAAGTRFGAFAVPTITGELRRHFRDTTWALHVPRGVQEDVLRIREATQELGNRFRRAPTVRELSAVTGLDAEAVAEALEAHATKETASLDQPARAGDEAPVTIGDGLGRVDDGFELVEDLATISPLLRALPRRDRELIFMRFAEDMTQSEIAARLGCSQMQVSRLLRRTLDRLSDGRRDGVSHLGAGSEEGADRR